jgi:hypothetical protein
MKDMVGRKLYLRSFVTCVQLTTEVLACALKLDLSQFKVTQSEHMKNTRAREHQEHNAYSVLASIDLDKCKLNKRTTYTNM